MTREEFNRYLKEWQVWRLDPERKLPNKFLHRDRRRAYEVFNDTFFTGEANACGPVVKSGPVVATIDSGVGAFKSTAASQWSTVDMVSKKEKRFFSMPFQVLRSHDGTVRGLIFDRSGFKAQVNHAKWLAHNPDLVVKMIQRSQRRKRCITDSALFL
jgi:hypothetical protein